MKYLFLLVPLLVFTQTPITEYHDNGNVFCEYFITNKTLDSTFVQYYKSGKIQLKRQYKECEYETNYQKIYSSSCGVGKYFDEEHKILKGKRHGKWISYYEDGSIKSTSTYHCGIEQGNFIDFRADGTLEYNDFYHEGNLITEREYHKNGTLKILIQHRYGNVREVVSYTQTEFRDDSTIKSIKKVTDYDSPDEKGVYKEYYPNGFLKIEENLVKGFREGVYREFYDNGNVKYAGKFIDEERIEKHYYFNRKGETTRIESWDKDKLIRTEYKK